MRTNLRILDALLGDPTRDIPGTHMHVIGSSGSGKSRFLQDLIYDATSEHCGLVVLDWHGSLYDGLLNHFGYYEDRLPIRLLDPSGGRFITPYNPFIRQAPNLSTAAKNFVNATVKAWGAENTDQTPRLARVAFMLFYFAAAAGETLPNAELLLRFQENDVRKFAIGLLNEPRHRAARENIEELQGLGKRNEFDGYVQSTMNRLSRFIADETVARFIAFKEGNLDIPQLLDQNGILLVNLQASRHLDADAARAFAAFLLTDLFSAAMDRPNTDKRTIVVLDEFQEYITPDLAKMLDAVRKGGLSLVMAHQRVEQITKTSTDVLDSVLSNARVKCAFAIDHYETARFMARQLAVSKLNENVVKDEISRNEVVGYDLKPLESRTTTRSSSQGTSFSQRLLHGDETATSMHGDIASDSYGEALTTSYALIPELEKTVSSRSFYSLEEKESRIAEAFMTAPLRTYTMRIGHELLDPQTVPEVTRFFYAREHRERYESELHRAQGSVTPEEADVELERSRDQFKARVSDAVRPKKKPKTAPAGPPQIPQ